MRASSPSARQPDAEAITPISIAARPPLRAGEVVPMVPLLPRHLTHDERRSSPASHPSDDRLLMPSNTVSEAVFFAKLCILTIALVTASAGVGVFLGQAGAIGGIR